MGIAVLGWGSLIPHPEKRGVRLRIRSPWYDDGPILPIEYARISDSNELTLVLYAQAQEVQIKWAYSDLEDLNDAIVNLRDREGTITKKIGYFNASDGSHRCNAVPDVFETIRNWALEKQVDAVIWTDLSENFHDKQGVDFSELRAIGYLTNLVGPAKDRARQYIQETPPQIVTHLRPIISRELGW